MSNDRESAKKPAPYFQDRELSWLEFNKRVLDQGMDPSVPLFERLNFLSIYWSNLQEFFMIRVGSLADLSLLKTPIVDSKTGMTTTQQLAAIYKRCHELYPEYDRCYKQIRKELSQKGILNKRAKNLDDDQRSYIEAFFDSNIMPFLSPQIVNSRHPFPHLENGALYVVVRLDEEATKSTKKKDSDDSRKGKGSKNVGAEGVTLGIIPLPGQCKRIIRVPGSGLQYMLLEHVIEMFVSKIFSMYRVKHTNVICVTRNADLDATEGAEEQGEDYREHIKRILKKRTRLMPVRLESERELSATVREVLLDKLKLQPAQTFSTPVPLNLSYVYDLPALVDDETRRNLSLEPFTPEWPASLDRRKPLIPQIEQKDVLISYPYESMDSFVQLLKEAASDPNVTSIKITLYRISKQSSIAEALVAAAENGKEVTALFELRARFDESNNIDYSQRLEEAGCNVLYGFRDYKVHSKICCITRRVGDNVEYITQVGTGNYNEKTARLYTDFSFMTTDHKIGRDAAAFFRNMTLENMSDEYRTLWVAPLQIKQNIIRKIDEQISRKRKGLPNGLFFKTNSITDKDVIDKIVEASQAGVKCTLLVRGISCIVPGIEGFTDNVCVVSIVGRLLEHSRIYLFGAFDDDFDVYLSSADLMTRNMDKRIEVAWPVHDSNLRRLLLGYIGTCMADTAKLRDLLPNKKYTDLGYFAKESKQGGEVVLFDSQSYLINQAQHGKLLSDEFVASKAMPDEGKVRDYAEDELDLIGLMVDSHRLGDIEHVEREFEAESYSPEALDQVAAMNAAAEGLLGSGIAAPDAQASGVAEASATEISGVGALDADTSSADNSVGVAAHGDDAASQASEDASAQETAFEEMAEANELVGGKLDGTLSQDDHHEKKHSKLVKVIKGKKRKLKKSKAKEAGAEEAEKPVEGIPQHPDQTMQAAFAQADAASAELAPADEHETGYTRIDGIADGLAPQRAERFSEVAADDGQAQAAAAHEEVPSLGIDGLRFDTNGGSLSLDSSVLVESEPASSRNTHHRDHHDADDERSHDVSSPIGTQGQFAASGAYGDATFGSAPNESDNHVAYNANVDDPFGNVSFGDVLPGINIDRVVAADVASDAASDAGTDAATDVPANANEANAADYAYGFEQAAYEAGTFGQSPYDQPAYNVGNYDPATYGQSAAGASDMGNPRNRAMLQKQWQQWIQQNPELYKQYLQQRSMQYQQLLQQRAQQAGVPMQSPHAAQAQQQPQDEVVEAEVVVQDGPAKKRSWLRRLLSGE